MRFGCKKEVYSLQMTGFNGENDDDNLWELGVPYFQTKPFVLGILSA